MLRIVILIDVVGPSTNFIAEFAVLPVVERLIAREFREDDGGGGIDWLLVRDYETYSMDEDDVSLVDGVLEGALGALGHQT
ncbi:hypothetical protein Tco_0850900 [Tanacetum coccineum]